jgi:hypothetical protein
MRRFALFFAMLTMAIACSAQQSLTDDSILKLLQAGLSEDLIVQTIHSQPTNFTTSADDIVALKKAGASDRIIAAVLDAKPVPMPATAVPITSSVVDTNKVLPAGSTVYVAPMADGFEVYIIAALNKKNVPVTVVGDRSKAVFEITGAAESQKAGWSKMLVMGSMQSAEQASINVANIRSGTVVFAYAVNKGNSVHGKQSTAEACAKHLKEKIESGK